MFRQILTTLMMVAAALTPGQAFAVPLETYTDYVTNYPTQSKKGQWIQLLARGIGTNDMYVMEVDPTTGGLPVDANITFPYDTNYGAVGADTLRTAAQIGNATGAAAFGTGTRSAQTLRVTVATDDVVPASQSGIWNINDISGTISLPTGAATEASLSSLNGKVANNYGAAAGAVRTASQIGNASGIADFSAGNYSAQTLRVVVATDQPAIPVSGSFSATLDNSTDYGVVDADTLRTASQIGNATGAADFNEGTSGAQTLRVTVATDDVVTVDGTVAATQSGAWNITNISGTVSLPTGAATEATLASLDGKVANNYGAAAGAVRTAAQVGNASGVADFNTGAAGAQTLRVVQASNSPQGAGRAYGDSAYLSYSSSNVTTGAWVELDASTAATINEIYVFSSCSETVELGTGAAAAETRVFLIPPGGIDGVVNLAIASGTRLSLRGVSGNCTTGQITLTGLN